MGEYKPPFHMTDKIMNLVADVSEQIGRIKVLSHGNVNPHLRKENRIRTIHSSLAIEHNSLSLEQVTAVINGKHILGNPNEIREVKNAYDTYEMMLVLNPYSVKDLLKAHKMMMKDLIPENGKFRSGGVGVFDGDVVVHMAPSVSLVPGEIQDLFAWYKKSEIHPLVRSAIFHYEFEFIHPFADGNGRMGRMWHSLLLGRWNEIFYWLPVEELIRSRQQEYYNALNKSDRESDSSTFVEFMLEILLDTLRETTVVGDATDPAGKSGNPYVQKLLDVLGDEVLSATEIMERLGLSHRPTFRKNYLVPALEQGIIEMTIPEKPKSRNQRYRKKCLSRCPLAASCQPLTATCCSFIKLQTSNYLFLQTIFSRPASMKESMGEICHKDAFIEVRLAIFSPFPVHSHRNRFCFPNRVPRLFYNTIP